MSKQKLVTLKEMAEILNRCPKTFRKYVEKYNIPHIRLGRDMLFNALEVVTFLRDMTVRCQETEAEVNPIPEKTSENKTNSKELNKSQNKYANLLGLS
jgi:excisionase family DNA binding protein